MQKNHIQLEFCKKNYELLRMHSYSQHSPIMLTYNFTWGIGHGEIQKFSPFSSTAEAIEVIHMQYNLMSLKQANDIITFNKLYSNSPHECERTLAIQTWEQRYTDRTQEKNRINSLVNNFAMLISIDLWNQGHKFTQALIWKEDVERINSTTPT